MVYLLILLFLLILLSIYDYKKDVSSKVINFFGDKNIVKCSLYFIYIFPIAVSTIVVFISNIETKAIFAPIISFYATALTITFTVYSFLKTQNATEKERIEMEEQREKERTEREKLREKERIEMEEQREKERIERENKDFELREKELEAQKDYYRPIFVIEECSNSKKKIILLMKDTELSLRNIKVYAKNILVGISENCINDHLKLEDKQGEVLYNIFYGASEMNTISYKPLVKSGDTITECDYNKSFISAETLIGETILFGFFAQNIAFYKYLKQDQIASFPNPYTEEINDKKAINEVWRSFNISENNNIAPLEKLFFEESYSIRLFLNRNFNTVFKESLEAETYSDFLNSIFNNISSLYTFGYTNEDNINITIKNFITVIRNMCNKLNTDSCDIEKIERIQFDFLYINSKFKNMHLEKTPVYTREFRDKIEEYLKYSEQEKSPKYSSILYLLNSLFSIIKIDPEFNVTFYDVSSKWKNIILQIEL